MSLLLVSFHAKAITLNFGNLVGTVVNFAGDSTFNFTSTNGYQFSISSVQGGLGDSVGLDGFVSPGGPFTIGAITTNGILQSANVTGSGVLHIVDALGSNLVGNVQWLNITTVGVGGILDLTGTVNLNNLMYPGANSDLTALAAAGSASDVVTFQFTPAHDLTFLADVGGQTSYSGSIAAVPEPSTWALLAMAGGIGFFLRGRKSVSR